MSILEIGILAVVIFVVLYVIVQFNGLVALRNHIKESWSNVDTELKRRHELIPNLVEVVKGYAAHERAVLERVTTLRAECARIPQSVSEQSRHEKELVRALEQLWMVAENYPTLRADGQYLELQKELVRTEDRIQAARRFFNGNVRDYQNRRQTFPSNLVAAGFGFGPVAFFEVPSAVRQAPRV